MAQFRTSADLIDSALSKAGEVTNGNSPYETYALNYLNRLHFTLLAGGTIPIGKDQTAEIDEIWPWSRARSPLILELQPKYETGTISLTEGSEAGTLSVASASSLQGWHLRVKGRDEWLKIATHSAGGTAIEFDGAYPDDTGATLSFEAVKFDYELVPSYITVDDNNNKIQFQEAAGVTQTGTLTNGVYSPSSLISHVATILNSTGGTPAYTGSYSAVTRKFTIASDRAAGAIFVLVGTGSQSEFSIHKTLGFDDEDTTNAASVTSTYVLGALCRVVEPMKVHKGASHDGSIYGVDNEAFQRDYPFSIVGQGIPTRFSVVREMSDGTMTVRFNKYPPDKTRVEVEHVPLPRDLKDSSASIPLIPRKHIDLLEDAVVFYIMLDKSDDRAQMYAQLVQGKLKAMIAQNRGQQVRTGKHFGQIVPRPELTSQAKRRASFGYDE